MRWDADNADALMALAGLEQSDPWNPWVAQAIARIAERLELVDRSGVDRRIQMVYELVYGREATAQELELGREFLASQADVPEIAAESMGAWQTYVQALVLANEFLYAD